MSVVAFIGKPNVGKSSVFNRLIGRKQSLVWNQRGVTRDRLEARLPHSLVTLWDLAGIGKFGTSLANLSAEEKGKIDLLLLVVDGSEGLTIEDEKSFEILRKTGLPCFVVVNKSDKKAFENHSHEIFSHFPKAQVFLVSAETGAGILELEDALRARFPHSDSDVDPEALDKKVLILGRPNVGKSSLMNALAEKQISAVSPIPGTTRDILEFHLRKVGVDWKLKDSAGIRAKGQIYGRGADPLEIFSVKKALREIHRSRFVLLVIEATPNAKIHAQDRKLFSLVRETLIPTLLIINKWDLVRSDLSEKEYREEIRSQLGDLSFVPILCVSAKTSFHLPRIFQILHQIDQRCRQIPTSKLNRWLKKTLEKKPPRVAKRGSSEPGHRTATQYVHLNYIVQTSTIPMSFQIFGNAPQAMATDDKRFLEKQLRDEFGLVGIPILLKFRRKSLKSS